VGARSRPAGYARRVGRDLVRRGGIPLLLAAALCAACSSRPDGVVLVVVDTLRADHLGAYGYERRTSPRIDALAADATLFRTALAPAPWTLPSLATLMTSLYPSTHGAHARSQVGRMEFMQEGFVPVTALHESHTTLAEVLGSEGFRTAAFVQGSYPSRVFGFGQGFEHFVDNEEPGLRFNVEAALEWLDAERPQRFFLYIHTVEPHAPYAPYFFSRDRDRAEKAHGPALREEVARYRDFDFDPDYEGPLDGSLESLAALERQGPTARELYRLIALYDRGVRYTDHWVGRLLDALAERGLYDQSLVILTSDHGEELFDHGGYQHGKTYYEEIVRVPLILRVPGEGRGVAVEDQVGIIDVFPTVLDVLGIERDLALQGRSLRPLWRGLSLPEEPHFAEAARDQLQGYEAMRTRRWKYVRRGSTREELYDLERDPRERIDRCQKDPAACEPFRRELEAWRGRMQEAARRLDLPPAAPVELDEETRERLVALGYYERETPPSE